MHNHVSPLCIIDKSTNLMYNIIIYIESGDGK